MKEETDYETKREDVIATDCADVMQNLYGYAAGVIVSKALPDVRDGEAGTTRRACMICTAWDPLRPSIS